MAKTDLTKKLEENLFFHLKPLMGVYGFYEVTVQDGRKDKRIDFVTIDRKGTIRCYEVKVSMQDFKSKHGHNFYGHYNYYVLPSELIDKVEGLIPKGIGIVEYGHRVAKRPKKKEITEEMKNNLILGMLCAGNRETRKLLLSEDVDALMRRDNTISRLENQASKYYRDYTRVNNELARLKRKTRGLDIS